MSPSAEVNLPPQRIASTLTGVDEDLAERRRILEAMRAPFRGVPHEEIEREAAQAVAEVRAEMELERPAAIKRPPCGG